jgi:hypothetical protein
MNIKTDELVFREDRFSLAFDTHEKCHVLTMPVVNRLVDYEECYRLTEKQYLSFRDNPALGRSFAYECRMRLHDALLILQPGADRGTPL